MNVIIVSPSLDPSVNVSGVSAVCNFIIKNNLEINYIHFLQGKIDSENGGYLSRFIRICKTYKKWKDFLLANEDAIIHYNYPLDAKSIVRDYFFIKHAYKKQKKILLHIHGGLYLFRDKKPFYINWILNYVFNLSIPIIVLSDKEKKHIENKYHRNDVISLPNCVDLSEAQSFNREYENKGLNILYLGRIEPNKGVDYILKAAKILIEKNIKFSLYFAGKEDSPDSYIPIFKSELGDCFIYEGVVSGGKKDDLLKKCNVFLLPSFYEGLPMSLLECMAFGMIPITTDVGSICSYVKNGVNGFIVPVKETLPIVDAIIDLVESSELMKRMSINAKETIFSQFDAQKYVEKLNHIYLNL